MLALGVAAWTGCAQTKQMVSKASESTKGVKIVGDHLELEDHIYFETGKADIKQDSHDLLNRVATVLKNAPNIVAVKIHGHTDNSGAADMNQKLSEARAASVEAYLRDHGVKQKLESAGFGQDKPLCNEDTDDCRAKNRRVEFLISKS